MATGTDTKTELRFDGAKLKLARSFRGWTLTELGERVSTSAGYVHHLESGLKPPTEVMIQSLATALGFGTPFFYGPLRDELLEEECHFRSRRMPAGLRTRVLSHGTLFLQFVSYLESRVKLPPVTVPTAAAAGRDAVERTAENCRRTLGLGLDRPITHMCRVLERMGIVVTRFEGARKRDDALKVDAFSRPRADSRPIVVLNTDKGSQSRARFDKAHELGHLIMHAGVPPGVPEHEDDANAFASAFLLPRTGFLREFHQQARLDWDLVFRLKVRWRVSAAAIVRRAFDLGRIDALEYRRAWKHYMYRRWHQLELHEEDIPEEPPELVTTALKVLERSRKMTPADVAVALGWSAETFEQIVGVDAAPLLPKPQGTEEERDNLVPLDRYRRGTA
jgi:Zn-dependent peptidase ImmA (M78 family)/transcriptional regulator with XRE-family HTH domain